MDDPSESYPGDEIEELSLGNSTAKNSANNDASAVNVDQIPLDSSLSFNESNDVDNETVHIPTSNSSCNLAASSSNHAVSSSHVSRPHLYNWQASKTKLKERLAFMFNNEILSDVHFIVGRETQIQRIPAHKFVLSIGSVVFDTMFNGSWATKAEEIELPDVEPASFLALLRFLYLDDVQIGSETVITTLYTAKKYVVPALEKHCVDFLLKNLCPENAFMLLTQARLFDESKLATLCLETIDKNTLEAVSADCFTDIDVQTLCVVLNRHTLKINEAKLFEAVFRWSKAECSRRNLTVNAENQKIVLGKALSLIRFPLMTVEEFATGPAQSGLLSDREVISMFLYFTVNPKPTVSFNDTPRCTFKGRELIINRFENIVKKWGYGGCCDRIGFSVDRKINIVGFGLYSSIHGSADYFVNLDLIDNTGQNLSRTSISYNSDGSRSIYRVMLKEPVEIEPNVNYVVNATIKGPESFYGVEGKRNVTIISQLGEKVTFTFSNISCSKGNGTTVEDGQIPEIIFYI